MILPAIIKLHRLYGFTYRQCQIALLTGWGVPHKAIADILGISQKTVEKFLERIHRDLGLSYSTQIAHLLISDGVIPPIKDWVPYTYPKLKAQFDAIPQLTYHNRLTVMKDILANEQTPH